LTDVTYPHRFRGFKADRLGPLTPPFLFYRKGSFTVFAPRQERPQFASGRGQCDRLAGSRGRCRLQRNPRPPEFVQLLAQLRSVRGLASGRAIIACWGSEGSISQRETSRIAQAGAEIESLGLASFQYGGLAHLNLSFP